jgi:hypothetical protein
MMFLTVALETTGITHNYDMKDEIFKESWVQLWISDQTIRPQISKIPNYYLRTKFFGI